MKFVIRSRILFAKLNDDRDQDMFERSLEGNFQATENPKTTFFTQLILISKSSRFATVIHKTNGLSERFAPFTRSNVKIFAYHNIGSDTSL